MKIPRWFNQNRFTSIVRFSCAATLISAGVLSATEPQVRDDSQMKAMSVTIGGAAPLSTTRTVAHWFGTTLNPDNGVTYGYNMVGAAPNNCSGSGCDVTVIVDVPPVNVTVDGESFNGSDALSATLASPVFATNDYAAVP